MSDAIRGAWRAVGNPTTEAEYLDHAVEVALARWAESSTEQNTENLLWSLANHSNLSRTSALRLATTPTLPEEVRSNAAGNRGSYCLTPEDLAVLSADPNAAIRRAVATHWHTTPGTLLALTTDTHPEVATVALGRSLAVTSDHAIARGIAALPGNAGAAVITGTGPNRVRWAFSHPHPTIRAAAALTTRSERAAERLTADGDPRVAVIAQTRIEELQQDLEIRYAPMPDTLRAEAAELLRAWAAAVLATPAPAEPLADSIPLSPPTAQCAEPAVHPAHVWNLPREPRNCSGAEA